MHELSITQNILDVAIERAENRKILRVNLLIGQLADEREDSIQFYWDDLVKDTPAEGAQLQFQRVPAQIKCLACETVFHPKDELSLCPVCQSHRLKLISGDDIKLDSIDVG